MRLKPVKFPIGLRTLKTAVAVVIAMAIVNAYGATTSKLVFAMLGAMVAMEPTFEESVQSCLTQIIGVFFGALVSILMIQAQLDHLVATGIGIILVITSYNLLRIRFSPSLPCLMVVTLCTTPDIQPISYALGRFWDTFIGLGIGMLINTLVFPYNNKRSIRATAESLEKELLYFLEEMFDGDECYPNTEKMVNITDNMANQLTILSKQWTLLRFQRNRREFEKFQNFEEKAGQVVALMEVLCGLDRPGALSEDNYQRLSTCGANIGNQRKSEELQEGDIVANYLVSQLLTLRQELLEILKK